MHTRGRLGQLAIASAASTSAGSSGRGNPKAASILPMLDKFHDIIGGIHVPVDDGVDKLNRKYTLLVFLFLALPIFTKQYIGDPIECFAPVYFAEHQSRYINSYCWTQSTYYMVPIGDPEDDGDQQEPPDRIMPDEVDYFIGFETVTHIGNERLRRVRVSYYQWAPLILLVQGLCFYIPFLIWNSCANNAGVKLRRLLKKASDIASLPPGCQQREALLAEFVDQFHTLVTGEAGWCADLQCGGLGGTGGGGLNSNSNSSASSSASANSSNVQQQQQQQQHSNGPSRGVAQTGLRGGGTSGSGGGVGGNQQHNHQRSGAHSGNTNVDSNQDDHDPHNSRHHRSNNNAGCCLISTPIIGSLLACCLKPCSSFGLVGPSKYLCLLYLAVKSAYVFNVGLQFFLLGQFLGRGYLRHGLELINRLIVNGDWWASPRFPLSTLCQVRADMSGGLRSYTCQCVLPINVFNEKIFSVVWFYMAFLMPLNVLSLLFWIYRTFETNRLSYIRLCLWRTRLVELNQIHRTVRRLSQSYLGWDGVFLLRLIEHNHGSIMATLIMSRLWEFYANQMKLQEDANQLALANNAQHTLSNTTTAISNQHQLLAAAAAAAAAAASNQPLGPPLPGHLSVGPGSQGVGGGPGHHNVTGGGGGGGGGANHGPQHGQSHGLQQTGHSHGPPLMPTQHQAGGGAHFAASHAHGPNPHAVSGGHFAGGQVNHGLQQQQHMAPLVGHGPHAHHSGQISQPGAHHPLHAANTHHAHAHVATAAGHHGHPLQAGPFASNMNANILAQLQQQQQHQHHHHQQPPGSGTTALSAAQSHNVQQSSQTQQQQQGSASGNVAAAVAALAAAAAANSTSGPTPGQQQQQLQANSTSNSATVSGGSGSVAASGAAIHLHSLLQPNSTGTHSGSGLNNSSNTGTSNSNQSTAASGAVAAASARSQQATSTIQTSTSSLGANNVSASNSSGAQTNNNINQPTSSVASISSSSTSGQQQQASSSGPQTTSANNGSSSATTSFIQVAQPGSGNASIGAGTGAGVGGAGIGPQSGSGPPLPPPPPAHIVAAVAAASTTNPTITPILTTNMGVAAPGMARTGPSAVVAANRGPASQVTPQQQQQQSSGAQPAPPPHTNPVLFNLKSSSLQAAATNNARQYSPHTIKR